MKPVVRNHISLIHAPRQRPKRRNSFRYHDNPAYNVEHRASNLYNGYRALPSERNLLELYGNKSRDDGAD
jgi:hypothetical protein